MNDWNNPWHNGDTYKQCHQTPYCYRPNSARRVNSVKELNRLLDRITELKSENKRFKKEYEVNVHNLLDRIDELEAALAECVEASRSKDAHNLIPAIVTEALGVSDE